MLLALSLIILSPIASLSSLSPPRSFTITGNRFVKDGTPMNIISGEMHYARVPPGYWRDRLLRLRALGMNTVATYVPWNIHEERPGRFNFTLLTDFLDLTETEEVGLHVLLRMGPYMCGEWTFGGLPAWLLSIEPHVEIRCVQNSCHDSEAGTASIISAQSPCPRAHFG